MVRIISTTKRLRVSGECSTHWVCGVFRESETLLPPTTAVNHPSLVDQPSNYITCKSTYQRASTSNQQVFQTCWGVSGWSPPSLAAGFKYSLRFVKSHHLMGVMCRHKGGRSAPVDIKVRRSQKRRKAFTWFGQCPNRQRNTYRHDNKSKSVRHG